MMKHRVRNSNGKWDRAFGSYNDENGWHDVTRFCGQKGELMTEEEIRADDPYNEGFDDKQKEVVVISGEDDGMSEDEFRELMARIEGMGFKVTQIIRPKT